MRSLFKQFRTYRNWWKTWGTLPIREWIQAAQLYKAGNFELAIPLYRQGLERHQNHAARICARLDLAYCLFKTNKFKEAEHELRLTCTLAPESSETMLRLAQFLIWMGRSLEAAWLLRRSAKITPLTIEMAATMLNAALEGHGPRYLIKDALEAVKKAEADSEGDERALRKLKVAKARLLISRGDHDRARTQLARLAGDASTSLEAIIAFSELLIEEGKLGFARQQLRRGLEVAPNHPRVLSLLAETYLKPGTYFNADFAAQLATSACQFSDWLSPREMHILAESQFMRGDKMSALLMASKAKEAGSRLLGNYPKTQSLNELINNLSSGTLG